MSLPICPVGCVGNLEPVKFDNCSPEANDGEIRYIYYTSVGFPMSDISSEAEWDSRIDNSSTTGGKIRKLTVIGDFPAVADNTKTYSGGRKLQGVKSFVLNATIDETSKENYNAIVRGFECAKKVLMWFETSGGLLFGGNEGIECSPKFNLNIPNVSTEFMTFPGTFTWDAKFHPEGFIKSPIKSDTGNV